MNYVKKFLNDSEYYQEICKKDLIVLHHTSGTDSFSWWQTDPKKIATCFLIDKDGTINQCFKDIGNWAYHIGSNRLLPSIEKRTIGIEIESMGGLEKINGKFFTWQKRVFDGKVFDAGFKYRGFQYFEAYEEKQIQSVIWLTNMLLDTYKSIPRDIPLNIFEENKYGNTYTGIVAHVSLRPDKSDVHIGFPIERYIKECKLNKID